MQGFFGNLPAAGLLKAGAGAANNTTNPAYTVAMFLAAFPEFTGKVTDDLIATWIRLADDTLSYYEYGSAWALAMGLFVAHNLILRLKAGGSETPLDSLLANASEAGIVQSKSVDTLSISFDTTAAMEEYKNWGGLKETTYGRQLIDLMKSCGGGGIFYVC